MKVFISADIEGVNNIVTWDETDLKSSEYLNLFFASSNPCLVRPFIFVLFPKDRVT